MYFLFIWDSVIGVPLSGGNTVLCEDIVIIDRVYFDIIGLNKPMIELLIKFIDDTLTIFSPNV